ncbi:MAG: alpha-glucan family phosphorylase [Anaerolineaceae bacterium]|nr:alpha-glucan family phosphorylase [Anaerolineaceae bacterium]
MENIKRMYPNQFHLPRRIKRLGELAYNLYWVWTPDAQNIFIQIDPVLWDDVNHNPVTFLRKLKRSRINAVTDDLNYLEKYDQVMQQFDDYMKGEKTWFKQEHQNIVEETIAYFSFEFGLHESLPVYAGGLGILSGDHLKEASDLGIPLTGVGFYYNKGYFTQQISEDGWQETGNLILDLNEMPLIALFEENGDPLMISVDLPGRKVWAQIYEVRVGRVQLYLLNTNVKQNSSVDQELTARLYSNDLEIRISQEILLGIGGARALEKLAIDSTIFHMNEGHSAFLSLERLRQMIKSGISLEDASKKIYETNVFTTHTPVPAGNDQFPMWLVDKYFSSMWQEMGLDREQFMAMGRHEQPWGEMFSMPVLALKLSQHCNAVSELHGHVSREMWSFLWPDKLDAETPIGYVTNGVHTGTWAAKRIARLYDQYMGVDWRDKLDDVAFWENIDNIPDEELWQTRLSLKRHLHAFITQRARDLWKSGRIHPVQVVAGGVLMDPNALTIGFARRFATYKRGYLILKDYERLLSLLNNASQPVQIVFAGKAHPADEPGKLIIQQIYRAVKDSRTGGRMIFMEDYDMNIARHLIQGVDIWMNTPRRPNEASGTSGMKAVINGVLNLSIMDGWWCEGYNGNNGWSIGDGKTHEDTHQQDEADANSLYNLLENQIIPLYYKDREMDEVPTEWIKIVKNSIRTMLPDFSMRRMLKEYMGDYYRPAMKLGKGYKK